MEEMDKTGKTIESYNDCADRFVQVYMDLGLFEKYFREISDLLKEGSTILDMGCGPGNGARFFLNQNKGYQIVGVDLSVEMLQHAKQYAPDANFILGDIRSIVFQQTFDAVIASFCIIHLSDNETAVFLRKTFNMLGPGGYLYLSFMCGGIPGFEKTNFSEQEMFFYYHAPEAITRVLEKTGYRVISSYRRDYQRTVNRTIRDIVMIVRKPTSCLSQQPALVGSG